MAFADWIDTQAKLQKAKAENVELRDVLATLLIKQGVATPVWEPARRVLGLPPAVRVKQ